jgi:hypothetical protein
VDIDRVNLGYLQSDMKQLSKSMDKLRWSLVGFSLSITATAILYALTVLLK